MSYTYIYNVEELEALAKELNVSEESLIRENWDFDGVHGYDCDKERWVSPSGEWVLLERGCGCE